LGLLRKLTLEHDALAPEDVRAVLDRGVSRDAVRDAFYVAFLFNTLDRLADTLAWQLPADHYYAKAARFLLKFGYR